MTFICFPTMNLKTSFSVFAAFFFCASSETIERNAVFTNEEISEIELGEALGKTDLRASEMEAIVVVESAPSNFVMRNVLRATWTKELEQMDIPTIFALSSGSEKENEAIQVEDELTNDIIQGKFKGPGDEGAVATLRRLFALRWLRTNVRTVPMVLLIDDKTLLNPRNLRHFLREAAQSPGAEKLKQIFCSKLITAEQPISGANDSRDVSEETNLREHFPEHCSSPAFALTGRSVSALSDASVAEDVKPKVRFDNLLITGIAADFAGVSRVARPEDFVVRSQCSEADLLASISLSGCQLSPTALGELYRKVSSTYGDPIVTDTPEKTTGARRTPEVDELRSKAKELMSYIRDIKTELQDFLVVQKMVKSEFARLVEPKTSETTQKDIKGHNFFALNKETLPIWTFLVVVFVAVLCVRMRSRQRWTPVSHTDD